MRHHLLITDDAATTARVHDALGGAAEQLDVWGVAEVTADAGSRITSPMRGRHPDTVILGSDAAPDGGLELAALIDANWPGTAILLVGEPEPTVLRAAMRAGIRDVLDPADPLETWAQSIEAATAAARAHAREELQPAEASAEPASQVIVVVSSKGGSGKTTVATNLAIGLAEDAPQSTVIVDLDLEFGDVANALRLTPDRWIQDLVFGPARADSMVLKSFLTEHESGLFAVCAPDRPEDAGGITAEHVSHLIGQLSREYRYVVIDTAPGLAEHTLAALESASDTVFVCGLDVPSIRGLRKELDILDELGLRTRREHLVLNDVDPRAGLAVSDAERSLDRDIDIVVPSHRAVRLSTNDGVPLLVTAKRGRVVRALRGLVERVRARAGQRNEEVAR